MSEARNTGWMPDLEMIEDGWLGVNDLPGWEGFRVKVKAGRLNGEPRIVGLVLEPREGAAAADVALSQVRLKTLPLGPLARAAHALAVLRPDTLPDLAAAVRALATAATEGTREDPRQATTPEQVARVYTEARNAGLAPRAAVCDALGISSRTADRYVAEARRRGLLAPYDERKTLRPTRGRADEEGRKHR